MKMALGGRLNYYVNEFLVFRSFYRYYSDDWGIQSHNANIEALIKISQKFTLYPSYRYYFQSASDYFAPYNKHLSTSKFYTSDYDLSEYNASQFSFGLTYTDIFTKIHIGTMGLKSIDLKYANYRLNTGLDAYIFSAGLNFVFN